MHDNLQCGHKCVSSNYKCDLEFAGKDMGLRPDMLSWSGRHKCKVI
jgi:hypothetical protein